MRSTTRFQLAVRRNEGMRLRADFLCRMSNVLGRQCSEPSLMSLEETDSLYEEFRRHWADLESGRLQGRRLRFPSSRDDELYLFLHRLGAALAREEAAMFCRVTEFTGALSVLVGDVLGNAERILELDGEEIQLFNSSHNCGMVIEYCTERSRLGSEVLFNLWVWGESWIREADKNFAL